MDKRRASLGHDEGERGWQQLMQVQLGLGPLVQRDGAYFEKKKVFRQKRVSLSPHKSLSRPKYGLASHISEAPRLRAEDGDAGAQRVRRASLRVRRFSRLSSRESQHIDYS